jgi:hypothetical protein
METPPQLSPTEAHDAIQRLLKEGDTIGRTQHARDRALERNVTIDDMRHVLVNGTVSPHAEWNEKFKNWNYVVSGRDCDNVPLALVIALEPRHCRITVVTVKDTNP